MLAAPLSPTATDTQLRDWLVATFGAAVDPWTAFQALFVQVLGRPIDAAEVSWFQAHLGAAIAAGTATLASATAFLQSYGQAWATVITEFRSIAGRDPSRAEMESFLVPLLDALAAGHGPTQAEIWATLAPPFAEQRAQALMARVGPIFRMLYLREITGAESQRVHDVLFAYFVSP